MTYDFETPVSRGPENLKLSRTSAVVREAGLQGFGVAEMDFRTFPGITERLTRLVENGLFGRTIRTREYDQAVVWWMRHMRNWDITPEELLPARGTVSSLTAAIRLFTKPGEGVIVQPPVYGRYAETALLLDRQAVCSPLQERDGQYTMDLEDLERKMAAPENRLLVLCNPHNPVGRVWTQAELQEVGRLSARYEVPVFSDEIFAEVTFGGRRTIPWASLPEGRARAITCTGLGKTFNFTGVNHANVLIPDPSLREQFARQLLKDHPGSLDLIAAAAVPAAYCPEGAEWVRQMLAYLEENIRMLQEAEKAGFPGFLYPLEGTFTGWIRWDGLPLPDAQIPDFLAEKALFDVKPGTEFDGAAGRFSRMNLACQHSVLHGAIERVSRAAALLK